MRYSPCASVMTVRAKPVSRLRRSTVALATAFPPLSLRAPRIPPAVEEVWAEATMAQAKADKVRVANRRFMRFSWAGVAMLMVEGLTGGSMSPWRCVPQHHQTWEAAQVSFFLKMFPENFHLGHLLD